MRDESLKIIVRRSQHRMLESGLLILAVALGIGAASAGIALWTNAVRSSRLMLESPAYREILVSTVSDAEDMEQPVALKPLLETAVLTSADLDAAAMAPAVVFSYVQNRTRLNFINEESIAREEERRQMTEQMRPEGGEDSPSPPTAPEEADLRGSSLEDLQEYALDQDILIASLEEASGFEVTPSFFDAWDVLLSQGGLFTQSDLSGHASVVVLGAELGEILAAGEESPASLVGKKLLTREGLVTVIGILEPRGEDYDTFFFVPYQSDQGLSQFRRRFMNTQLRFRVDDPEALDGTALLLQQWFDSQYGEEQVVISNPRSEALQLISRNKGIGLLILFLSLAGLFIASVNVSNILMSRAMRMKKHVGILMALGASRRRILKLFGAEALGITLIGAVLGAGLSIPLGQSMQRSLDMSGGSWMFTLLGIVLASALTLAFGLLPARQHSGIDPALAMRAA